MFNFQRVIISLILSLLLIITFCIPTSFIKAFASPLKGMGKIYPLTLSTEGNDNAGIKGYDYEYAYLKTSEWTTLIGDLEDGNSMLRVDMFNIPGTGIDLGFGITYNSFNSDLDIGLGKGWTSDLHQSVYEDPLTHNVTCVSGSGAKLIFEYNTESGKYNSPKGFSGELTKKGDGTYEIKTIGKEKLTFDNTGKLRRVEKCGGGSYEVNYDASGRPSSMIDTISGRNITLTWDETGKLTEVKDSMNQTWTLNYSEDGNKLLSVTKPDNTLTTFNYSEDYKLTEQVDFEGHSYQLGYYTEGANSGKLESWTDPSGAVTSFNYETNIGGCEKKTTLTDGEGRNTFYCFGESEHLEEVSEVSGSTKISFGEEKKSKEPITLISLNDEKFVIYKDRAFATPRIFAELIGARVDWIESNDPNLTAIITINFPVEIFGKQFDKPSINCFLIRDFETQRIIQKYCINRTDYYFIHAPQNKEDRTLISLRGVLEPLFELQYKPETRVVEIYYNPFYNRVKFLPQSSEIIINYELHKLNSGLIKQNKEVFISLREFIELISGKIDYNPASQYNSPEIVIKPANINKEIRIYPKIDKAILINSDSQEKREITFTKSMINKNGSYFIGLNDIISILEAEKHTYLDSEINTYFNFEF